MSLGNDPYNPTPPMSYETPPPPSGRPTSVTVLAIIGIIFGALGTLCSPMGLVPYFVKMGPPNPMVDAIKGDTILFGWTVASTVVGWIMSVLLLSGSIGSLMLKEWARKLMLAYAWVSIVVGVISSAFTFIFMMPRISAQFPGGAPGMTGMYIGSIIGLVLGIVFPLCVIIFFSKPHVRAAFARDAMTI